MTLDQIWQTLKGHPERTVELEHDPRLEALDWRATDSPSTLEQRAESLARLDGKITKGA